MVLRLVGALAIATSTLASPAVGQPCVDLALVLAVDNSGSVSDDEFVLQTGGFAAAFRSPSVRSALAGAGDVAIAAVFWGDSSAGIDNLPWHRIRAGEGTEPLAFAFETYRRRLFGNTHIGGGLNAALDRLEAGPCAHRRVVDVSGDGRETSDRRSGARMPLGFARVRAEALGVTVNALAILDEELDLADYYATRLIVGPGAFVMTTASSADFAAAISAKLVREIEPALVAGLVPR
jgi:hypothetical protein